MLCLWRTKQENNEKQENPKSISYHIEGLDLVSPPIDMTIIE